MGIGHEDTTKAIREENFTENNQKTVEKILTAIHNNSNITQKELVDITGLTRRGVEWNILQLKNNGIIRRDGADKGGKWVIIKTD